MNSGTGLIAPLVQSFFTDHLVRQRRASPQTVASYRDTFRLLIQHLSQTTGKKPSDLTLVDLQAKAIMRFLDGIERDRGNSVQTRNARLAAIRSFFRLVTLREPAHLDLAARRFTKRGLPPIGYLTIRKWMPFSPRQARRRGSSAITPCVDAL
jgi:site-specific recombinase XerD